MPFSIKKLTVISAMIAALTAGPGAFAQGNQEKKTRAEGAETAALNIMKEVRHELVTLPYYSVFDNLEYRVEDYTVYLTGQVTRPTLKSDAEARVKDIEGVENVVNQIEVLPVSNNDDRIRLATYRAIFGHSGMQRYAIQSVPPIHIIVKNGHVRLVGVVGSEADKNVAFIQARGVPGAFSVENELRVEGRDD